MTEQTATRRDLLRTVGGLAAAGTAASLSGCGQISDAVGGSGGKASIETVPAGSQYVLETDFGALYSDEALREGINEELSAVREEMQSEATPDSVTDVLDRIESNVGLDPRGLTRSVLSGTYETEADEDQTAYTFWAEWSEDELVSTLREEGSEFTEASYGETTLYVESESYGPPTAVAVLSEGVFSIGTRGHVEATIDTWNGDADPVSGDVRSGYDASTDGHLRYAFDVVASEVPESAGARFDTSVFTEVAYGYGSLSPDGDDRVATLGLKASSEDAATDMSDILQGALTLAEQQVQSEDMENAEEIVTALEATEVTADGSTATVTHARPAGEFAAVATPILLSFVLPQGTQPSARTPQVAFGYEYDPDASTLTITHEGGDTVPARELFVRGTGFTDAEGVDQTRPGPWQGESSDEGRVRAGDAVTLGATSDYEISVVWRSESGETSATLARSRGPDA